ncbi:Insulin enhancer protein isl-2b [Paragonimus heterotremus]|uniref:Insulin enhancer protein isl-2b n=1 Tax=Paragonimus heterotremus TaxID=100268 RepID=A0A8J4SSF4_9TREM|nr:Insulin enhancer protein isl-2b [Paragonimus heterotremus]
MSASELIVIFPSPHPSTFFYRCAGCNQVVSKSELVYRVWSRAFHLDCFRCVICDRLLQPGEEIAVQNEQICCLNHNTLTSGRMIRHSATARFGNATIKLEAVDTREYHSSPPPTKIKPSQPSERLLEASNTSLSHTKEIDTVRSSGVKPLLLPTLLQRTDPPQLPMKLAETVGFNELHVSASLCVDEDCHKKPIGSERTTNITSCVKFGETDGVETLCSSPQGRPNSSGSSLGVAIRDADSPLTASSELSHEDESSSLLGLSNSISGVNEAGLSQNSSHGLGSLAGGTYLSHPYAGAPQGVCGGTNGRRGGSGGGGGGGGSRAGSGSSSSGTSMTGGCGDEVVHSVSITRSGGSRPGKSGGSKRSKDQKTTRVRTVLNEKQLHTLRTCYAANPRPDALMKEQLVEMTSLSPRVIRVWFQNKRCKDKKRQILLQQMEQHQQSGGRPGTLHGIPMVAGSPVRNDSSLVCPNSGIDIQQISGPYWKAPVTNELIARPGSHCSVFKPGSPYTQQLKSNLNGPPSPNLVSTVSDPHLGNCTGVDAPYPTSMAGNVMNSYVSVNDSLPTLNALSMISMGPTLQTTQLNERSRFNQRNLHGGLTILPNEFAEELQSAQTTIPAFQQLVSCFNNTDNSSAHLSNNMMSNSAGFPPTDFPKLLTTSVENILFPSPTLSQLVPNVSIPARMELDSTKLDQLLGSGIPVSGGFPLNSSHNSGLALFPQPNRHTSPSCLIDCSSPVGVSSNLLSLSPPHQSSHQQLSGFVVGPCLHGAFPQPNMVPHSRAPLST